MKIFLFRAAFLLLLVFLQLSFFNIFFPWFRAPLFLLGGIAAFALVRPFPGVLFMTVPMTLLFDGVSSGAVTWFSFYAVFFAYVTSFLLRRLLLEHRGFGFWLYAVVVFGAALFYQVIFSFVVYRESALDVALVLQSVPSIERLAFSLFFFLPIFQGTYFFVKRFEEYLALLSQKQFRNVR
ncbi:MAG: hypothetical protein WA082_02330 [Candidatus Moraniibacteriota bacterium]